MYPKRPCEVRASYCEAYGRLHAATRCSGVGRLFHAAHAPLASAAGTRALTPRDPVFPSFPEKRRKIRKAPNLADKRALSSQTAEDALVFCCMPVREAWARSRHKRRLRAGAGGSPLPGFRLRQGFRRRAKGAMAGQAGVTSRARPGRRRKTGKKKGSEELPPTPLRVVLAEGLTS